MTVTKLAQPANSATVQAASVHAAVAYPGGDVIDVRLGFIFSHNALRVPATGTQIPATKPLDGASSAEMTQWEIIAKRELRIDF